MNTAMIVLQTVFGLSILVAIVAVVFCLQQSLYVEAGLFAFVGCVNAFHYAKYALE